MKYGSTKTYGVAVKAPSQMYLRLIRGEVTAKEYADNLKKKVDRQIGRRATAG